MTDGRRCADDDDNDDGDEEDEVDEKSTETGVVDIVREVRQIGEDRQPIAQNSTVEEGRNSARISRDIARQRSFSYERTAGINVGDILQSIDLGHEDLARIHDKRDEPGRDFRTPGMIVSEQSRQVGSASGRTSVLAGEESVINEAKPIKTPRDAARTKDSPGLSRRMSRTDTVRQDVRRLKSATLDRMGRMFRTRVPAETIAAAAAAVAADDDDEDERSTSGATKTTRESNNYGQDPSRKAKTNSLGRMLKLIDKDGTPRKLFADSSRTGSLSRIFRRHGTRDEKGSNAVKSTDDNSRGLLSRVLGQLRSRPTSNAVTEPNVPGNIRKLDGSSPPKGPSSSRILGTPPATSGSTLGGPTRQRSIQRSAGIEYQA